MSLLDALKIGSSAIRAANAGIDASANNVANALTPGYGRRVATCVSANSVNRAGLWVGGGVVVTGFQRTTDGLLGARQVSAAGASAASTAYRNALQSTEIWFDETQVNGPTLATAAFFEALDASTVDPADIGLRTAVVNTAADLGAKLATTALGVTAGLDAIEADLAASLPQVNDLLDQIGALNLAVMQAGGINSALDLVDARDTAMRSLAELTGAVGSLEADGSLSVYLGGHCAVSGGCPRTASLSDASPPGVRLSVDGGTVDITANLGGSWSGLLAAHAEQTTWLTDLDAFAVQFATAVNDQLALGFDLNGVAGGPLFTFGTPPSSTLSVVAAVDDDPALLAFAGSSTAGPGDGVNLAALGVMDTAALVDGLPPGDFLASLTNRVGSEVAAAEIDADSDFTALADLDALQLGLSGVDLDEEAAQLVVWQAAYQAAAQIVTATQESLDALFRIVA